MSSWPILIALAFAAVATAVTWRRTSAVSLAAIVLRGVALAAAAAVVLLQVTGRHSGQQVRPRLAVLADVSGSMSDEALESVRRSLDRIVTTAPDVEVGVLPFSDAPPAAAPHPVDGTALAPLARSSSAAVDVTRYGPAVAAAFSWIAQGPGGRVLILTDGKANPGPDDALPENGGIPVDVHVVPSFSRVPWVNDAIAGWNAEPGTILAVTAWVHAGADGYAGSVRFEHGGAPVACATPPGSLDVPPGGSRWVECIIASDETRRWGTGIHQILVRLDIADAVGETFVRLQSGRGAIVLGADPGTLAFWDEVLPDGLQVRSLAVADLPKRISRTETPIVILNGASLTASAATSLARYVRDGGHIVAVNGPRPDGLDRIADTALQALLPLTPRTDEQDGGAVVLAFAIDASASTGFSFPGHDSTEVRDMMAEVARRSVEGLPRGSVVIARSFQGDLFGRTRIAPWPDSGRPLAEPAAKAEALARWIRGSPPGGNTNLCDAVERVIADMKATVRGEFHGETLFVLTDAFADDCVFDWEHGYSDPLRSLAEKLASSGLSVSLLIVDPFNAVSEGPSGATRTSHHAAALCDGTLCAKWIRRTARGRFYGPFPVAAIYRKRRECGPVSVRASGQQQPVFDEGSFTPFCDSGAPSECRKTFAGGALPAHRGWRRVVQAAPAVTVLSRVVEGGPRREPVAALREGTDGTGSSLSIATDPAGAWMQASATDRRAIADFWREVLAGALRSEAGSSEFDVVATHGGSGYEVRVRPDTGLGADALALRNADDLVPNPASGAARAGGALSAALAPGVLGGKDPALVIRAKGKPDTEVPLRIVPEPGVLRAREAEGDPAAWDAVLALVQASGGAVLSDPVDSATALGVTRAAPPGSAAALPLVLAAAVAFLADVAIRRSGWHWRRRR